MWGRGTVLGGRYKLAERLGGGGMGEVWRADDGVLERRVAVKILLPALLADATFAERFRREARILAALDHPGIVDVHDYGESDGGDTEPRLAWIVMELVDGRPLDEISRENGPMAEDQALGVIAQALDALHAAHRRGVVHRDIKPSNLMVDEDGRVTVTDFGIARSAVDTTITASHAMLGTARYMAPEQARGEGAVPGSDLYAIGAICYELLTGEPPFGGDAVFEVVLKHIGEPAPELPGTFGEPVRALVAKALAKEPGDRHADAATMAAEARRAALGGSARETAGERPAGGKPTGAAGAGAAAVTGPTAGAAPGAAERRAGPGPEVADDPDTGPAAEGSPGPGAAVTGATADGPPPGGAAGRTPERKEPEAAPVPAPAKAASAPDPATAGTGRWKGRALAAALLVLGLMAGGAVTALVIEPPADRDKDKAAVDPGRAPTPGGPAPEPGAAPPSTPAASPTATAAPATSATPVPGGTGAPLGGGPSAGGDPGAAPTGGPTTTKTAASTPNSSPPQGCGGADWGAITNVGDNLGLGLAADGPDRGKEIIMGGHTQYGWVRSTSQWVGFHSCNLNGPALGQPYGNASRPELAVGFGYSTNWKLVQAPTAGAYYIKDYQGQYCLTSNGAGKALSVVTCTPGNKAQQWRVP